MSYVKMINRIYKKASDDGEAVVCEYDDGTEKSILFGTRISVETCYGLFTGVLAKIEEGNLFLDMGEDDYTCLDENGNLASDVALDDIVEIKKK